MVSTASVYKDIIPGYYIRALTEVEKGDIFIVAALDRDCLFLHSATPLGDKGNSTDPLSPPAPPHFLSCGCLQGCQAREDV
jgi:hypothetical protein